jgi:hypothetical protein
MAAMATTRVIGCFPAGRTTARELGCSKFPRFSEGRKSSFWNTDLFFDFRLHHLLHHAEQAGLDVSELAKMLRIAQAILKEKVLKAESCSGSALRHPGHVQHHGVCEPQEGCDGDAARLLRRGKAHAPATEFFYDAVVRNGLADQVHTRYGGTVGRSMRVVEFVTHRSVAGLTSRFTLMTFRNCSGGVVVSVAIIL